MGVGGLVTGIMGATGAYPRSSPPSPAGVGKDYSKLLGGYLKGSPQIFANEATYQPMYADLAMSTLGREVPTFSNIMRGAAPGAMDVVRGIDPAQTQLLGSLRTQAGNELGLGSSLGPDLTRLFQQSMRGGQAARGMGFGPADVFGESMGMTQFGQQLKQQRQGFAGDVSKMGFEEQTTPALGVLASIMQGGGTQGGPTLFNPQQSYDMFNTAYNARAASNIANQNAQTAMLQGFNSFD